MSAPIVLADDFFRLAHDDATGRARLNEHALGLGLAAALLAELMYAGRIGTHNSHVFIARRNPPQDVVGHAVLDRIAGEPVQHTIRAWLSFLAVDAYGQVAGRLLRAGHVQLETSGFLWARTTTYVPVDVGAAAGPMVRLIMGLRRRGPMNEGDVFLAGLALAAGLDEFLRRDVPDPAAALHYLHRLLQTLWQPALDLLRHTHAVIGNALVSHRL